MTLRHQRIGLWLLGSVAIAAGVIAILFPAMTPLAVPVGASAAARGRTEPPLTVSGATPALVLTEASFEPVWGLDLRRPLYDPPPVVVVEPVFVPPPLEAHLAGTVVDPAAPDNDLAMLVVAGGAMEIKRVGDTVAGAQILKIDEGSVTVRYYDQDVVLSVPEWK